MDDLIEEYGGALTFMLIGFPVIYYLFDMLNIILSDGIIL